MLYSCYIKQFVYIWYKTICGLYYFIITLNKLVHPFYFQVYCIFIESFAHIYI